MSGSLEFGFVCKPAEDDVAAFEALPIDSLWVGGRIASPTGAPEVITQLTQLAGRTQRVRIGTSILLLPLYPPAIVAKQLADIDHLSEGRLTVGVGAGGDSPQEFEACGVPLAGRGARMDEAIGVLRSLWTCDNTIHTGPFFPMRGVNVLPKPVQPGGPRIVIAGRKGAAFRRAATLGDGWMPYLYSPERYRTSVTAITEQARAIGRDLHEGAFAWSVFLFIEVDRDRDSAWRRAGAYFGNTYGQSSEALLDRIAAVGTSDEVAARVSAFVAAGVRQFVFCPATNDPAQRFETACALMDDVVPAVVRAASAHDAGTT